MGAAGCAAAILWSIMPRRDNFNLPGALVDASSQPRLFTEIQTIAAEFEEPMPASVYIVLDANAWVAQRGGILGFGSRRVMALGLPLLSFLTVSELRAVLAHEFAHFYGGDTGLGPSINRARESLGRSLQSLSSDSGFFYVLSRLSWVVLLRLVIVRIFEVYWKLFLRLTLLVSRQWEYRADELACTVAGTEPLLSGLRKLACARFTWPLFWQSEAATSILAGFRPPLAEGFARFLQSPAIANKVEAAVTALLEAERPNAFATHPTFKQRSARALSHRFDPAPLDNAPAITLCDEAGSLESSVLHMLIPNGKAGDLKPVSWEVAGPLIYIPLWTRFVAEYRDAIASYCVGDIPKALANLGDIAARVRDPKGILLTRDQRAERSLSLIHI